jgi:Flp pilus assembly protein TadB
MTGAIFRFDTEEQKVGWVTLFTSIVMVITVWMTVAEVDKSFVRIMIAGYVIIFVAIVAAGFYERRVKKAEPEPQDERSAMCSLKATRNTFLFALVLMAVYMILGSIGAPLAKILALQTIFGISLAVYSLSYLYYKRVE